jgi:hypothetical protein
LAARTIAVILGTPNGDRGANLAILASIWTHSSRQLLRRPGRQVEQFTALHNIAVDRQGNI